MRSLQRRLLATSLVLLASCGGPFTRDGRPPNIILISIDSLRPDHLGCYGYGRPTSPEIDRLARDGILFENARSVSTWTLPAHMSMLTGLAPDEHGVLLDDHKLSEQVPLLPALLAPRGYRSAAVASGAYVNGRFGYDHGWEVYDDSLAPESLIVPKTVTAASQVRAPEVDARARALLDRLAPGPFLLFLHEFDVHYNYIPPPPWDRAFDPDYAGPVDGRGVAELVDGPRLPEKDLHHLIALYDGEIGWVDSWIGRLERELVRRGLDRDTVIVITADHGDEFFEHGHLTHHRNLFDTTLRVPLIIRLPNRRFAGRRIAAPVSLLDIAPTLIGLAGGSVPDELGGHDLLRTRFGRLRDPEPSPFAGDLRGESKVWVQGDWKLMARVRDGELDPSRVLLFDTRTDPEERVNRALEDRIFTARLFVELRNRLAASATVLGRHPAEPLDRDPELDRQLRSLGYL